LNPGGMVLAIYARVCGILLCGMFGGINGSQTVLTLPSGMVGGAPAFAEAVLTEEFPCGSGRGGR